MGEEAEQRDFRRSAFDRDYWLCRCQGFRVYAGERELGVVEEVRFESRLDRPDRIVVRSGFLGRRRRELAVEQVREIRPELRRLDVAAR